MKMAAAARKFDKEVERASLFFNSINCSCKACIASVRMRRLTEQIEYADEIGLDVFGVGEHHRREFLDSAPALILAAMPHFIVRS
jgi:hypothetical protein